METHTASSLDGMAGGDVLFPDVMPITTTWRLPNGMSSVHLSPDTMVPFPAEVAEATTSIQYLGDASYIFDVNARIYNTVTTDTTTLAPGPLLVMRLSSSGRTDFLRPDDQVLEESAERYSIHFADNLTPSVRHLSGNPISTIITMFTAERVRTMTAGQRLPGPIQRILDGQENDFSALIHTTANMQRIAAQMRANPYYGAMASLYTQGKSHELLLAALIDLAGTEVDAKRVLSPDRRKAMAARDRLMADLANPVSVELLAREVGLSERRLNEVFRDSFGMTVFEWLVDQRLNLARDMLERGDLSIKEIAFRLGYERVNTFAGAFVRRFSMPPIRYRNAARSVGSREDISETVASRAS